VDGRVRRSHAAAKRDIHRRVRYSPDEFALVLRASAAAGLEPGAFAAAAAVAAAKARVLPRPPTAPRTSAEVQLLRAEVRELRRLLGLAGGNLNQIAARANATREPVGDITAALSFTRRVITRIDDWLMTRLREDRP
jgi:hypothetical protein